VETGFSLQRSDQNKLNYSFSLTAEVT